MRLISAQYYVHAQLAELEFCIEVDTVFNGALIWFPIFWIADTAAIEIRAAIIAYSNADVPLEHLKTLKNILMPNPRRFLN